MSDVTDLSAIDLWKKYQYGLISIQEYQEIQDEIHKRLVTNESKYKKVLENLLKSYENTVYYEVSSLNGFNTLQEVIEARELLEELNKLHDNIHMVPKLPLETEEAR